jgi:transcriptional regulator with XRE-family HTH domain
LDAGRRVRIARISAGLSRGELAARLDVSFNTLERIESGRRPVTVDELAAIGKACQVPEAYMLEGWAAVERANRIVERNADAHAREARFTRALGELTDEIRQLGSGEVRDLGRKRDDD